VCILTSLLLILASRWEQNISVQWGKALSQAPPAVTHTQPLRTPQYPTLFWAAVLEPMSVGSRYLGPPSTTQGSRGPHMVPCTHMLTEYKRP
jgi:hypothetical protein